ncbi:hypothetical protein [Deinococcus radiodurans]|jgi:hypothetical protein|nr:hypothetical protein [Deinococcus radiodurans]ANC73042.1 hypothetical protein A2G07_14435 [Deinococcus radiodurans R1 = ATCC 13939 = DSM 20539]QIP30322.1 hypothetical protein HAV23_13745 [Deinococcus radiodurans]QIP33321.1 hypothetical protein HAV35_14250 [Deinococcus radiodurans]UID71778.1 hypothetical protein DRO_A0193 [Deinococcus radiodurans R1 = ATCC 13939 = DSM 20539]UTA52095.1 hypothetical protein MSS93_15910 [Deinococcus radiodurans]
MALRLGSSIVGGGGRGMAASGMLAPGLTERSMAATVIPGSHSKKPPLPASESALYHPSNALRERGDSPGHMHDTSAYTETASRSGLLKVAAGIGLAALAWQVLQRE